MDRRALSRHIPLNLITGSTDAAQGCAGNWRDRLLGRPFKLASSSLSGAFMLFYRAAAEAMESGAVVVGQPVTGGVVFEPPPLVAYLSKTLEERAE